MWIAPSRAEEQAVKELAGQGVFRYKAAWGVAVSSVRSVSENCRRFFPGRRSASKRLRKILRVGVIHCASGSVPIIAYSSSEKTRQWCRCRSNKRQADKFRFSFTVVAEPCHPPGHKETPYLVARCGLGRWPWVPELGGHGEGVSGSGRRGTLEGLHRPGRRPGGAGVSGQSRSRRAGAALEGHG